MTYEFRRERPTDGRTRTVLRTMLGAAGAATMMALVPGLAFADVGPVSRAGIEYVPPPLERAGEPIAAADAHRVEANMVVVTPSQISRAGVEYVPAEYGSMPASGPTEADRLTSDHFDPPTANRGGVVVLPDTYGEFAGFYPTPSPTDTN